MLVKGGFFIRAGIGYDVHKLVEGRLLILGGVRIPFEKGLDGHSDADVVTHAVMDSLLGAATLGDIGLHFPDINGEYKNISSIVLLGRVCALIKEKGYCISNIDCVVVAQRPKIAPYIAQMQKNIAHAAGIEHDDVSVKATTTEGLGFEGRGEGISAHAICILERNDK